MWSTTCRLLGVVLLLQSLNVLSVSAQAPPPPPSIPGGEDFDDPGFENFGPPPPPSPSGQGFQEDFNPPPPPPGGFNNNAPPPPTASDFGGGSSGGFGGVSGGKSMDMKGAKRPSQLKPTAGKMKLSDAQPEDFTNENFPELIESFDYPNADIRDVIKAISELTGKNIIIDNNVSGKITIVAPTRITVAEAWKAFLSALAVNNLTIVPSGKFLKIKNARQAMKDSIETYSGSYFPNAEQMITRILQVKHISAEELVKTLRPLLTANGEMNSYQQTNSLIISDMGSNIERLMKIVSDLDKPGFEEQLEVIIIRNAKASQIADLITQIINKESGSQKGQGRFNSRIPRFRAPGQPGQGGAEQLSMVAPDERTNSLIVLGNRTGIERVQTLVRKLDIRRPVDEAGGVFVYHVKHGEAEKLAQTLSGIAGDNKKGQSGSGQNNQGGAPAPVGFLPPPGDEGNAMFGAEVRITADKATNALIITASKQDYDVVKGILSKIDVPRDQVFVEAIIIDLKALRTTSWRIDYYKLAPTPLTGTPPPPIGRAGFRGSSTGFNDLLNPASDSGAVLGFGSGETVRINIPGVGVAEVKSLLGFINFVTTNADANVLSTPRVTAMNNEEAEIEVGEKIPVAQNSVPTAAGVPTVNTQFEDATIKLKLTPFISPKDTTVRMKVEQQVSEPGSQQIKAANLAQNTQSLAKRIIKTNIAVQSGDTAVLGGLIRDQQTVEIQKVPILGDIPILGWLFKSQKIQNEKRNLVVFLTPRILRTVHDNHKNLDDSLEKRLDYIKENNRGKDPFGTTVEKLPRLSTTRGIKDEAADDNEEEETTKKVIDDTLQTF